MNFLDKEVLAALTALVLIASIFNVINILFPPPPQHYVAIGLLSSECVMSDYPTKVYNGDNLTLCVMVDNHLGYPALFQVRYKIVTTISNIPSNTTPSPVSTARTWEFLLEDGENITALIDVPVDVELGLRPKIEVILVFELWSLNPDIGMWEYTGRWAHLRIDVYRQSLGGGKGG